MNQIRTRTGGDATDWSEWILALFIGGLTFAFFAPAGGHGFVMFDDDLNIYANPQLGQLSWERVRWAFADDFYMPRYMPLGWLSLMAIFEFGGLAPAAYHWTSLTLHAVNAMMVFFVVRQGLCLVAQARGGAQGRFWVAGLAAAAGFWWAVHPLRVEPVAWATGLHYVHSTFWALLATLLTWARLGKRGGARRWCLGGAWVAYLLSVLVYPVTLGLPAVLWLFEVWARIEKGVAGAQSAQDRAFAEARWRWELLPFWVVAALALGANVFSRMVATSVYPAAPGLEEFSPERRGLQAAYSAVYYALRPLVVGEPTPVHGEPEGLTRGPALVALGLLLLVLGLWWRRWPGFAAWCLAFAAAGVSYYGLLESPFQPSDRYTYFPSLVLAFGGAALGLLVREGGGRTMVAAGFLLWTGWLAAAVPGQLKIWRNDEAFFTHLGQRLGRTDPGFYYAGLLSVARLRSGDQAGSEAVLVSIRTSGGSANVLDWLEFRMRGYQAQARGEQFLRSDSGVLAPDALWAQQQALNAGRAGEARTARKRFMRALAIDRGYHDARYNFALWLTTRGEFDEAMTHFEELARCAPNGFAGERENRLLRLIRDGALIEGSADLVRACDKKLGSSTALPAAPVSP